MKLLNLNGSWKMRALDEKEWTEAVVPGSVYADLLRAGKMEDPFYRENEWDAMRVTERDFEYVRAFSVSEDVLNHDHVLLRCEGLDTLCDVFLNDICIFTGENMHRTYEVDIKAALRAGENTLRVVFHSPNRFIAEKNAEMPNDFLEHTMDGFAFLRKAHYMFGWDWGPRLPDAGIWRDISIVGWDIARLNDVYVTQEHTENAVALSVRVGAETCAPADLTARVAVTVPDGKTFAVEQELEQAKGVLKLDIKNPQLWWPNGMGAHPLYDMEVTLLSGARALDSRSLRIGLRTLTVKMEPDEWGASFAFTVNGVSFFAKGGNYIPQDNIISRVTREKTEILIKDCVQANFNMLRVWGGGYYPEDFLYDLCDEYGLVVWQDLGYACGVYSFTDAFRDSIVAETKDNVGRLRHHACLGLWCGNNEMESAWHHWGWKEKYGPHLQADYIRQFEYVLPHVMKECDPQTFYWRSSPSSTGDFDDPDSERIGDMHYWGVWHGQEPFTAFRTHFPRFMSEFGLQSFPCLKTVETFTLPEDRNIFSPVMESHQKNRASNGKILYYISETYRYPKDFDSLLLASQLIQAEGIRYGVEHWRRSRGRCMGTLIWQVNDCWPVASWSSIDYYGRWKALHYATRRFYAPVLLSACEEGASASLHVTNDRRETFTGTVRWRLLDDASRMVCEDSVAVAVDALSDKACAELDFSDVLDTVERQRGHYLAFALEENGQTLSTGTVLFVKPKHFAFHDPELSTRVAEAGDHFAITVSARSFAVFVELSLTDADVVFSDNYFDISGGEEKTVTVPKGGKLIFREIVEAQLRARSLYDTYTHGE